MISVTDLKKSFPLSREQCRKQHVRQGVMTAVDGVSLEAPSGRIFALLGPNGAGKTTTLRCLSGLIEPDEGQVMINGVDRIRDPFAARQKLCFLTSELKLDEHFTTDYLVTYYARLYGRPDGETRRIKAELFAELGIEEFADVKIGKLSTGMKQKAMIALNLIHDPEVIIFDEPTNGLDIVTARSVTDTILRLRDKGKTILLSTHIMEVAERVSDTVAIMLGGKLVMTGAPQELYAQAGCGNLGDLFFQVYKQWKEEQGDA